MHLGRFLTRLKFALKSRVFATILGPHSRAVIAEANGCLLAVNPCDTVVGTNLRINGSYGKNELARLAPFVTPESAVLVVGGHIGALAIPLARRARKLAVLEPNPDSYKLLTWNILLNECKNVEPYPLAASDRAEEIHFLLSKANTAGSKRVPQTKSWDYYWDRPSAIQVQAVALDDLLEPEFDVVIMDVEGSETRALKGMSRILDRCRCLAVEFLPEHIENVTNASLDDFLEAITPHFRYLTIPSKNLTVPREEFRTVLGEMYTLNEGDEAVIFES